MNLLKRIFVQFFSCIHVNLFVNCYIKGEGKEEAYVFEFILIFEFKVVSVLIGIFFKEFEYFKLRLFFVVLE